MIIYDLYCDSCDAEYRLYLDTAYEPKYCPACGSEVNFDADVTSEEVDDEEEFEIIEDDDEEERYH